MKVRWPLLFLLILFPACATLPSASEGKFLPTEKTPPVTRNVLENGLTVLLKEVHRMPVVSIMAYVKTGSAHEEEWTGSGISHAVEHMFFKGTETRGVGEIEKLIRAYGGDINAFTSHDVTGYTLAVSRDHYQEALALLADALMYPKFDPDEFEKEKEVILSEIRFNRDDPLRRASDLLWQNAYRNHPYRHPIIGYESLFKRLDREDLVRYFQKKYVTNNIVLVIVGDIQAEEALNAVKENFQRFERGFLPPEPDFPEAAQKHLREVREAAPVQMTHILLGYHTVDVTHPDMYPLDVLAFVLGGGESSRLVEILQKEKQLVYGIQTSHYTPVDPGLFTLSLILEKENVPLALKGIREEIEKITSGPLRQAELEKAKQNTLSHYYFSQETVQSQARDLAGNEAAGLSVLFSRAYVKAIAEVAAQDVKRVAQRYLREGNLTSVVLEPEGKKESRTEQERTFPEKDKKIQKWVLPNGIRVLLQQDADQPTASLGIALLGGLRYETPSTEGISNFVSQMLLKGTTKRREKEISEWVDSRGAVLSSFSGQNSIGLRLKLLKQHVLEGIQFLGEILRNASFREDELEKERKRILGAIRADKDQIFNVGERYLRQTLYREHPYRFYPLGREETLSKVSREALLAFYEKIFSPERIVITVFGDIDIEHVKETIDKNFSSIQKSASKAIQIPTEPPIQEPRSMVKRLPKEQALLFVGFHGISLKDEDVYPFQVLTKFLSGGGGRLYSEIRDKRGQAYTLGAYPVWGLDPGHYVFYVATTPEDLPSVQEKVFSEIDALHHVPIPDQEIERAKESLVGLHKLSLQTPEALSFQVALDELYGLGYDRYLQYEAKIRSVTEEDLRRIASRYLDLEKRAVVVILPENNEERDKE